MTSRSDANLWARRRRAAVTTVTVADRIGLTVSVAQAWSRVRDAELVAGCIPGLVPGSLEREAPTVVRGAVRSNALGITALWNMPADMRPLEAERRLEVRLKGEEPRLGMQLAGFATVVVAEKPGDLADLEYQGQLEVTGRLAAAGGPIIRDLIKGTLREFVTTIGGRPEAQARSAWPQARPEGR